MSGQYIKIPLTKGYFSVIDAEDFDKVSAYRWFALISDRKHGRVVYAKRNVVPRGDKSRFVYMHREIMDAPIGVTVDHINGDGMDNRKCNLRLATHGENLRNSRRNVPKSGFHGVSWYDRDSKWVAQIVCDGEYFWVGRFDSAVMAAVTYDEKAREIHGEFATLNFGSPPKDSIATENIPVGQVVRCHVCGAECNPAMRKKVNLCSRECRKEWKKAYDKERVIQRRWSKENEYREEDEGNV